jgi:peptidoglycan/xylan/chitin deacetylase (PgdA/CDA1 family)
MKIAFSWDDGATQDQRLIALHEKYGIPGMFFVPTRNREGRNVLSPDVIKKSESEMIRFGGHTDNHTYLTTISLAEAENEIKRNKDYLENILGHSIPDFCMPGGQYNDKILNLVYKYYKTARTADTMNFQYKEGPLKPAFHFYPRGKKSLLYNAAKNRSYRQLMNTALSLSSSYFDLMKKILGIEAHRKDSIIMMWGHSWEIDELNLWNELENLFIFVNSEIKDSIVEYESMFCSTTEGQTA